VDDTGEKAVIYADLDGDGYGDALSGYKACGVPEGYSANSNDCDDTSADVNPDAAESCDEIDNDCNGQVDDNPTVGNTYYPDGDGDGYGSTLMPMIACSQPAGYASVSGDCNDSAASTNPGASEVCNGQDDNCDGQPDNGAVDELTFYLDADGDGQGGSSGSVTGCTIPDGYVADGGDCNDADAAVSSSALEVCDGIDNDCSGVIDDNASDAATWYNDTDGDGVGDSSAPQLSCTQPEATSVLGGDCDDANPASYPGATELCDDLDNDCDTEIDNGVSSVESYADSDGDGYGTGDALVSCEVPEGYTQVSGDCDDANASVNPGAAEICDETDNDCDDDIDEGVAQQGPFYTDRDGDGYGSADASGTYSCTQPDGTSTNDDDCNDNNNDIYPGAAEPAGDIDYNCDGELTTENPEETSTPSTGDDDSPSGDDDSPSGDDDTAEDTPDTGGEVSPTPTTADDAGGCSCSQPSSSAPGQQAGSLMVALLGLSVLRRRARR
jgi:hypothetical protein